MDTKSILAWGVVAAILGVIVFVRGPQISGASGGEQASQIINSTSSGAAAIIHAAEGL